MASLPRLPPRSSGSGVAAAPRSHHQPSMGFGGALLAMNRQHAVEAEARAEREARQHHFNLPSLNDLFRRVRNPFGSPDNAPATGAGQSRWSRFMPWSYDDDRETARSFSPLHIEFEPWMAETDGPMGELRRRVAAMEKPSHWKVEYTHPDKLHPGFSFDFAPAENGASSYSSAASSPAVIVLDDDTPGSSNAASSSSSAAAAFETTLVCARCLDPLILSPPDGASDEDRKRSRVWALRCGHMLDGKCIAELMLPPPPTAAPEPVVEPTVEETVEDTSGKGKGKARAHEPAAPAPDRKGKRKAVEPPEPEASHKRPALADPSSEAGPAPMGALLPPTPESPTLDNSIRSRLRSRGRAARAGEGSRSLVERLLEGHDARGHGHGHGTGAAGVRARARRGKGKGRAKAPQKPVIEAEYEWVCPVSGCGRLHYSVRIAGEWRHDETRGGIALYV